MVAFPDGHIPFNSPQSAAPMPFAFSRKNADKTILLLSAEKTTTDVLGDGLRSLGYNVLVADSFENANEMLDPRDLLNCGIDLLISDSTTPENEIEVLLSLLLFYENIGKIRLSDAQETEDSKAINHATIKIPCEPNHFFTTVRQVLARVEEKSLQL